jgi:hypothetical protein
MHFFTDLNDLRQTATPDLDYDPDIFTLMLHISELVGTSWFFGLPFDNATNTTGMAAIAATAENILGDTLLALQLGNEPDLCVFTFTTRSATSHPLPGTM